jgi:endogenous inhibitor of DNA gyrase (YacG/DUF329 family)
MTKNQIAADCPTCKKANTWTPTNAFRPFCSERCKLIDLGAWASEQHRIEGTEIINDEDTDKEE